MEFFLLVIALITAGISLAMGSASLTEGLSKDGEKIDLVFGIMCISLFVFFIIPPLGFVWVDRAPYSGTVIIKRVFNFLYAGIMPWFVLLYTDYKKKLLPFLSSILFLFGYLTMAFTTKDSNQPLWFTITILPLGLTVLHGFIALGFQYRSGEKSKSGWLFFAFVIYLLFYLPTAINQFSDNYFGKMIHAKIFYPINLYPLAFILLMGVRLRTNANERFQLKRSLRSRDIRWDSLMENTQTIFVNLDKEGNIKYINPYAVRLMGYTDISDMIGKNWFDHYLPDGETSVRKAHFQKIILKEENTHYHKSDIICKNGDIKIISWSNLVHYDDEGKVNGSISIGTDISEQEKSILQIMDLKAELEKENLNLNGEPIQEWIHLEIIGTSKAITYAIQKAKQVAQTNAAVLLEGETGVGKELFADLIQKTSLRNSLPFVKVNCSVLPADLIEDELFGHEKGAFTGAIQHRKGRFEMANGGTIFLDELGELPINLQPKLLRVLQSGEFERIGGQQTLKVDVRIIAATNRDLGKEIREGRFRNDLFYRLNVFPITIPSLRNRKEDIPMLVHYFIEREAKKHGKRFENISKADINHLQEYSWPGNIRELKNVIERAVISSITNTLKLDPSYFNIDEFRPLNHTASSLELIEKDHILKVLAECNWRINGEGGAAEILAMNPNTLRSRMKKLNIIRKTKETSGNL
ncbi:MAG TPA: sigma 54-interacting transcriptional regulator [Puia sp.]|jgi:PAS domain S-box-containing protein|nr:sigma 54-interacting transcriptional regulator [Puia sp.]